MLEEDAMGSPPLTPPLTMGANLGATVDANLAVSPAYSAIGREANPHIVVLESL